MAGKKRKGGGDAPLFALGIFPYTVYGADQSMTKCFGIPYSYSMDGSPIISGAR